MCHPRTNPIWRRRYSSLHLIHSFLASSARAVLSFFFFRGMKDRRRLLSIKARRIFPFSPSAAARHSITIIQYYPLLLLLSLSQTMKYRDIYLCLCPFVRPFRFSASRELSRVELSAYFSSSSSFLARSGPRRRDLSPSPSSKPVRARNLSLPAKTARQGRAGGGKRGSLSSASIWSADIKEKREGERQEREDDEESGLGRKERKSRMEV